MEMCDVCCLNYNSFFICNNCKYKCCKICCKKYFLQSFKDPCCLNCGTIINNLELIENFGIRWNFSTYMKSRNKIKFHIQKQLLFSTKREADIKKKTNMIKMKRLELFKARKKINEELYDLKVKLIKLNSSNRDDVGVDNGGHINKRDDVGVDNGVYINIGGGFEEDHLDSNTLVSIRSSDEESLDSNNNVAIRRLVVSNTIIANRRFSCSCSCDGFLDESYKCMVCLRYTCEKCYSVKEEGHFCNNTVNIYNISKKCPCCEEYITKDDGCNLIKCSKCNSYFDWNSNKIIDNIDHIDHINQNNLHNFNKLDLSSFNNVDIITLRGMHEHIFEFIRLYRPKLIKKLKSFDYINEKMRKNRISYLINKISQIQFEKNINKLLKFDYYERIIIKLILIAYDKAIIIFNNGNNYLEELNNIIRNTNNILIDIAKYLKYKNNIKIHHWFNLEGIKL